MSRCLLGSCVFPTSSVLFHPHCPGLKPFQVPACPGALSHTLSTHVLLCGLIFIRVTYSKFFDSDVYFFSPSGISVFIHFSCLELPFLSCPYIKLDYPIWTFQMTTYHFYLFCFHSLLFTHVLIMCITFFNVFYLINLFIYLF